MTDKTADTNHPIHASLATRWSPYCFAPTPVSQDDLASLFEAARWAASSFNEQPWRFIVGQADAGDGVHRRILKCLVEANQHWAANAPVLVLALTAKRFTKNDKPNGAHQHDLGLAVGNLVVEATTRGLACHQMAGIDADAAAAEFSVPEDVTVLTAIAIGTADTAHVADDDLVARDRGERARKPLSAFVFGAEYGQSADWSR